MVPIATKTLLHDKLRFVITVLGVAFAVTLVLVQVGLFLGLLDNASVTIDHLDADLWVTSRNTPNVDFAHEFSENRVERVRSIPGVAFADNLIVSFVNVALPSGAQEGLLLYGLDGFERWSFPWKVLEGRLEDLRRGRYLFLDQSAERRFGPFAVGEYREVQGQRMKIIGRTADALSFTTTPIAFADYRQAQSFNSEIMAGKSHYVVVRLAPGADLETVRAEIRRRLPFNDVYTGPEWSAHSRSYWVENTGLGINLSVTVFLGCLVGVVVVAQTLYTSTMEHLKEFGTVKAIGGSNADIYRILVVQAVIAACAGFALGLGPSFGSASLVAKLGLQLIIPPVFVAVVFAGTVALCLAASLVSFHKVASIDPALVFRA